VAARSRSASETRIAGGCPSVMQKPYAAQAGAELFEPQRSDGETGAGGYARLQCHGYARIQSNDGISPF
jgi:hypothetical protein